MPIYTPEIQYVNLADMYSKAMGAQNAIVQNRLLDMQMREAERKLQSENAAREIFKKYSAQPQVGTPAGPDMMAQGTAFTPAGSNEAASYMDMIRQSQASGGEPVNNALVAPDTPFTSQIIPGKPASPDYRPAREANYPAMIQEMGAVDPDKAFALARTVNENRKHDLDLKTAEANLLKVYAETDAKGQETIRKNMEILGSASYGLFQEYNRLIQSGVPESQARKQMQPAYSVTLNQLAQSGLRIGTAPTTFDPIKIRQAIDLSLSVKERLAENRKAPERRTRAAGNMDITEEWDPESRTWKKVSEGPRWNPNAGDKDFRNESAMRKEFLNLPEVKDYPTIDQQSKRALKALQEQGDKNIAVDQSIITTFNKMLDPSSVVRESEYARTAQDMDLLNRIKGKWERVKSGGAGLTSDERKALYRMISAFKEVADTQYNEQVDYYSGLAQRYGYKPENVVRLGGKKAGESPSQSEWMKTMPPPGQHKGRIVEDEKGNRWQSDGKSWRTVK